MCGGGPENVTTTTNSAPPEWMAAPMESALNEATNAYSSPLNQVPADSIHGAGNRLVPRSRELVDQTLAGDYLSPDSNPFLQSTFNRAADLTRGRLDSEFSGAGRNLGASMPARSEELQTLASNIYGGNYQAERDRQFNAVGQAESLDPLNQLLNRIGGIVPGAGGVTTSVQPYFKRGLFG